MLSAPSSRFLDLLTPLRTRKSIDAIASNADIISLTSDDPPDDSPDGLRSQLAQYKRRKVELSAARASLTSLQPQRGGEEFIDLKQFATPPTRPTPPPSSSSPSPSSSTPWMLRAYLHPNFSLRLHEELLDFAAFISPTSSEERQRTALLSRFTALIRSLFPSSSLAAFGSYATKLYLPMSDIDVVVFDTPEVNFETGETALEVIAEALRRGGWASYLEVISNARIPIVKFTDKETGLKVDVCRDQKSGLNAAQYVTTMAIKFPAFRPLILFLKYFLYTRKLNDTYSGGIGSYLLQLLLLSHLHCHPAQTNDVNLGLLLLSFFDMYGHQLNYGHVGLSLNPPSYYSKEAKRRYNSQRPFLLSVENPLDVEHDVGVNSFCIMKIRRAFQFAFAQLTRKDVMEGQRTGSLLQLLVSGDEPILAMRGEKKRKEVEKRKDKQQQQREQQPHDSVAASMNEEKTESRSVSSPHAEEKVGAAEPAVRSRKVVKRVEKLVVGDAKRSETAVQRGAAADASALSPALVDRPTDRTRRGDKPSPLVRWYMEKKTEWMSMSSHEGAQWLKAQGLTKAERAQLRQFKKQLKKGNQAKKEKSSAERRPSEAETKEGAEDGEIREEEVKAAARPAWLDLSPSRFKEFLEKEVVVTTVQRAMRKTWKAERKRMKEEKREPNSDMVHVPDERQEQQMEPAQWRQPTLDSLWGTDSHDSQAKPEGKPADSSQTPAQKKQRQPRATDSPPGQKPATQQPRSDATAVSSSPSPSAPAWLPTLLPPLSSSSPLPFSESTGPRSLAEVRQSVYDDLIVQGLSAAKAKARLIDKQVQVEVSYRMQEEKLRAAIDADEDRAKREPKVVVQVREQMLEEAKAKAAAEGKPPPTTSIFLDADVQVEQKRRIDEEKQRRAELQSRAGQAKARGKTTAKVSTSTSSSSQSSKASAPSAPSPPVDVVDLIDEDQDSEEKTPSARSQNGEAVGAAPSSPRSAPPQAKHNRSSTKRPAASEANNTDAKKVRTGSRGSRQSSETQKQRS